MSSKDSNYKALFLEALKGMPAMVKAMSEAGMSVKDATSQVGSLQKELLLAAKTISQVSWSFPSDPKKLKKAPCTLHAGMVLEVVSEDYAWSVLTPGDRGYVTKKVSSRKGGSSGFVAYYQTFLPHGATLIPKKIDAAVLASGAVRVVGNDWDPNYPERQRAWFKHVSQDLGHTDGSKEDLDCRLLDFIGLFPGIRAEDLVTHGFGAHPNVPGTKIKVWYGLKRLVKNSKVYAMPAPDKPPIKLYGEDLTPITTSRLYRI